MENAIIRMQNVQKFYGDFQVLKNIDFQITKGEVVCVIGPSGSGKSTFLRCINQLESISSGLITVNNEIAGYRLRGNKLYPLSDSDVARQRRAVGMVF